MWVFLAPTTCISAVNNVLNRQVCRLSHNIFFSGVDFEKKGVHVYNAMSRSFTLHFNAVSVPKFVQLFVVTHTTKATSSLTF